MIIKVDYVIEWDYIGFRKRGIMKLKIEWKSQDHIKLANIYMNAPDNISCWDGCLQSSFELMEQDTKDAMKLLKKEKLCQNIL